MKSSIKSIKSILFLFIFFILAGKPVLSDDTCMFEVSADDVPPNIVFLLDNGAATEQIVWHPDYNDSYDFTPTMSVEEKNEGVNGFFNKYGYIIEHPSTNTYNIIPIGHDLLLPLPKSPIKTSETDKWYISEVDDLYLPYDPPTKIGDSVVLPNPNADGPRTITGEAVVPDDATGNKNFIYSMNYLNWLFFSRDLPEEPSKYTRYTGDGTDLPSVRRIYYAKKALLAVGRLAENRAKFGIYNFTNDRGASQVLPLKMVVDEPLQEFPENNILNDNFENNIETMVTTTYSPLAEGLETIKDYFNLPSSHAVEDGVYCQKNFVIVVSSGLSSQDQDISMTVPDYDKDGLDGTQKIKIDGVETDIPVNYNGSTYLDDVAYYLYNNDIVGYVDGTQNIFTYTVGFMGDDGTRKFLINTSNNGNGNLNLYDTTDPEYGKYHYEASNPDNLADELLAAINAILSKTSSFTAPVVPVTRTTSGNQIYLAFFKPGESNFWEGNVTKFGLSSNAEILNADGTAATWPNGAIKE
ncbi:MAG: hypothetical protein JJV89_04090, partial [Desulfosarcina sp.]|nr:hypothetical protein [Desulfobacterales bacterium]